MSQKIIDVHTHVFNLHYLPVRGILRSRKVPPIVASGVAYLFVKLTGKSNLFKEIETLETIDVASISEMLNKMEPQEINGIIAQNVDEKLFKNAKVQLALIEHQRNKNQGADEKFILDAYDDIKDNPEALTNYIYEKIKDLLDAYEGIKHYIKWFFFMMRSEDSIHQNLKSDYGHIDTFVFHMMDPWLFFKGQPKYSMKSKIKRMRNFIQKSDLNLIGFVPYNPRRKSEHLSIVKNALKKDEFQGIKFYPPMGYRASQNDEYISGIPNVKYGAAIEKRVQKLFKFTVKKENDIPVFTHCTPTGFEAVPKKSGKNAHPMFWRSLLKKDEFNNLRLCLGHAGGVEGWFASNETEFKNSYAKIVYDLCITYPNVYCEVGFLADVKQSQRVANFTQRLTELFKNEPGPYNFSDKIMYGSDWHILFNHGIHKQYDKEFETIFSTPGLKNYKNKFFYENAKKYLKLI